MASLFFVLNESLKLNEAFVFFFNSQICFPLDFFLNLNKLK